MKGVTNTYAGPVDNLDLWTSKKLAALLPKKILAYIRADYEAAHLKRAEEVLTENCPAVFRKMMRGSSNLNLGPITCGAASPEKDVRGCVRLRRFFLSSLRHNAAEKKT
jgi:hypothetical protein